MKVEIRGALTEAAARCEAIGRARAQQLGHRLKALREARGISQRRLSDLLAERGQSAHYTYLSHLETQGYRANGVRYEPSAVLIGHLADVLGADRDELLALAGKPPEDVAALLVGSEGARRFFRAAVEARVMEMEWDCLLGYLVAMEAAR